MGFGGGGSRNPPPPTPEPVVPVPQEDDPKSLDTKRRAAAAAKTREGYASHLLNTKPTEGARGATIQGVTQTKRQSALLK